ncbi:hypothetical protein [Palleronia sp.]|uniref:hypothetical protein n=1 Tax=Palleronia sp. TaxID=1940284 RepID=UPI0035C80645
MRFVPAGAGREVRAIPLGMDLKVAPLWIDDRLVLIAIIVLAMALAEGAAKDWLPILMVDEYGLIEPPVLSSLLFSPSP